MRKVILLSTIVAALCLIAMAPEHGGGDSALTLILKTLNLLLFFGGLTYLLAKPFSQFVRGRDDEIRNALAKAKQREEGAARMGEEIAGRITAFKEEEANLKKRFEDEISRMEEQAKTTLAKDVETMKSMVATLTQQHGQQVREQLRQDVRKMALSLAEELLVKEVSPEDKERFMRTVFEELSA